MEAQFKLVFDKNNEEDMSALKEIDIMVATVKLICATYGVVIDELIDEGEMNFSEEETEDQVIIHGYMADVINSLAAESPNSSMPQFQSISSVDDCENRPTIDYTGVDN